MLTGLHFLLSYRCIFECDHCFVYSGPGADSTTFTLSQVQTVLDEALKIGTVEMIYFEGGEAFLVYPLLIESVRLARSMGFSVGIVTNAFFATSAENAELWLRPLCELGISDLSISDDPFHHGEEDNPARRAIAAAKKLGLPVGTICIEAPTVEAGLDKGSGKGEPVIGGDVMFKGRAVEKLTEGLPRRKWDTFTTCPYEDLERPKRVHLDPQGHTHLCQGLSMGNMWETPLSELVKNYDAAAHPISRALIEGGPALLAQEYGVAHEDGYVDACHFCYLTRLALIDRFPEYLAPRQVYGLA